MVVIEQMVSDKKCTECGKRKLVTEFHSEGWRSGKQQFCSRCKVCKNAADKQKRQSAGYARPFTASDAVVAELNRVARWRYPVAPAQLRQAA